MKNVLGWILGDQSQPPLLEFQPSQPRLCQWLRVKGPPGHRLSVRWFKSRKGNITELQSEGDGLFVGVELLGWIIRAQVSGSSKGTPFQLEVTAPAVGLGAEQRLHLKKFLREERVGFEVFVKGLGKQRQAQLTLTEHSISISGVPLPYNSVTPQLVVGRSDPTLVLDFRRELPQLKALDPGSCTSVQLRFISRQARDLFFLGTKVFAGKRELSNSFVLRQLEAEGLQEGQLDLMVQAAQLSTEINNKEKQIYELKAENLALKRRLEREQEGRSIASIASISDYLSTSKLLNPTLSGVSRINLEDEESRRENQMLKQSTAQLRGEVEAAREELGKRQLLIGELRRRVNFLQVENQKVGGQVAHLTERLNSANSILNLSTHSTSSLSGDNRLRRRVEALLQEVELLRREKELLSGSEDEVEFYRQQLERSNQERMRWMNEAERLRKELGQARKKTGVIELN